MVEIIDRLVECVITGLATALFLLFFGKMGWLPFMLIMTEDMLPPEDD
ncbi:MAG: hypothetical protein ACRDCA_24305 [Serratia sp. (in: enterobacteria)]